MILKVRNTIPTICTLLIQNPPLLEIKEIPIGVFRIPCQFLNIYAGGGKTQTSVKCFDELYPTDDNMTTFKDELIPRSRKLIVTNNNDLCVEHTRKFKIKAITPYKLFGLNIEFEKRSKQFNVENYDMIIFDEIIYNSDQMLQKIKSFVEKYRHEKILVSNGDICQLDSPCDPVTNEVKQRHIDSIFPNKITGNSIYRFKKEEDKERVRYIHKMLFQTPGIDLETKILDIVKTCINPKNIIYGNTLKTKYAFTYYNTTKEDYNRSIFKKCGFELNTWLISTKTIVKNKKTILRDKIKYQIIRIDDNTVTILNEQEEEITFSKTEVLSQFSLNYARTIHSSQGKTVESAYTIMNMIKIQDGVLSLDSQRVNENWAYVALTRATDFENIYIRVKEIKEKEKIECWSCGIEGHMHYTCPCLNPDLPYMPKCNDIDTDYNVEDDYEE